MIDLRSINLRAVKGAPLSVLIAMAMANQPVGVEYLERITGYSDKPVEQALKYLAEMGQVRQINRYTWALAGDATQLPFFSDLLPVPSEPNGTRNNSESPQVDPNTGTRNFSESPQEDPNTATRNNSESRPENPEKTPENDPGLGEIPSPAPPSSLKTSSSSLTTIDLTTTTRPESEILRLNLAECERWGIEGKKAKTLATRKGMTPEYIRAHCNAIYKGRRIELAMAIYRMDNSWEIPMEWIDPDTPEPEREEPEPEQPEFEASPVAIDPRIDGIWKSVLDQIRPDMPKGNYETWVACLAPIGSADGIFTLASVNSVGRDWVDSRLNKTFANLLSCILGEPVTIQIVVNPGYCDAWRNAHRV